VSRRVPARAAVVAALVAALAATAATVAGAGAGADASAVRDPSARPPGASAAADDAVTLTVTFTRRPGVRRVAHVRCSAARASADGWLRSVGPRRACAHAREIADFLTGRSAPRRACAEIYGGPERALATGRIGARKVRHGFSRTDGCGIADWRRAMPLLPRPS
jgi:hypothetical protein